MSFIEKVIAVVIALLLFVMIVPACQKVSKQKNRQGQFSRPNTELIINRTPQVIEIDGKRYQLVEIQ